MKKLQLLTVALLASGLSYAQHKKADPICISYTAYIDKEGDQGPGKYIDAYYQERFTDENGLRSDFNFNYDKLDQTQIRTIADAYVTYIQRVGKVMNYTDYFSMLPSNPGSLAIERGNSMLRAEQLGPYYFDPKGEQLTVRDGAIHQEGTWSIEDREVDYGTDTVYTENLETGEFEKAIVENTEGLYDHLCQLRFLEMWDYDYLRGRFNKEVKYLGLQKATFGEEGEFRGAVPFLTLATNVAKRGLSDPKALLKANVMTDVMVDRYACEDGISALARTSDAYNYIEPSQKYELILSLLEGVRNGNTPAVAMNDMVFSRQERRIGKEAFFDLYRMVDTFYTENLETGELEPQVIAYSVTLEDIIGFKFVEDWYFDTTRFIFYKKVKYVGLLEYHRNEEGELLGTKCRAFIKMN